MDIPIIAPTKWCRLVLCRDECSVGIALGDIDAKIMKTKGTHAFGKVTVIMPVYNGEQYIADSINSILAQAFTDFELLIIDDGSTDSSRRVIRCFNDPRIRLLKNKKNLGLAAVRNKGIDEARGEYIAWLDSDDISHPQRLKRQVQIMDENPQIGLCGTWVKTIGCENSQEWRYPVDPDELRSYLLFYNPFATSSIMVRRSVLSENGLYFRNDYPPAEDFDLWVRVSRFCAIVNIPEFLTFYRIHHNQISTLAQEKQRVAVQEIQHGQIRLLGLELDQRDLMIIHNLTGEAIDTMPQSSMNHFMRIDRLLHSIVAGNHIHKCFPDGSLKKFLSTHWESAIYNTFERVTFSQHLMVAMAILFSRFLSFREKGGLIRKKYLTRVIGLIKRFLWWCIANIHGLLLHVIIIFGKCVIHFQTTNRAKILIVPEFAQFGGSRTYFKTILQYLHARSAVVVIVLQKGQIDDEIISLIDHYRFRYLEIPAYTNKKTLSNLVELVRILIRERPRTVFASIGNFSNFLEVIMLPINIVYLLHVYPTVGRYNWRIDLLLRKTRKELDQSKLVVTVSEFSKKMIKQYWVDDEKNDFVKVIANASRGHRQHDKICKATQKKREIVILTLGHVAFSKNAFNWILVADMVMKRMKDHKAKFVWAGDGPDYEANKEVVEILNCKNISFIGYQKDVDALYSQADIYFQPSNIESQGLAVLDAMTYGIPCVVSNCGGLPETVIDGVSGFVVDVNDIIGMAHRIIQLAENKSLRERIGCGGYDRVMSQFSQECWTGRMNELFDRFL